MNKDKIFSEKKEIGNFEFNQEVAEVFDDMLVRSVPFYSEIQRMVTELTEKFSIDNTNIYDLGCSTGTTMLNIFKQKNLKKIKIIGIDYSQPMIDLAKKKLKEEYSGNNYEFFIADLNKPININNASVVLMILTLQFVRPIQRELLIKQIYDNLQNNGCLIITEKIIPGSIPLRKLFIDFYYKYKKSKGYSDLEISQKREALENVLIPYTLNENFELLRRNGFKNVDVFFNWYNFAGIIGVKE
jgi:tRNA (cmo5U34)-methyltransferase